MPSGSSGHQAALAHGTMPLKVAMSYKDDRLVMSSFYGVDALDGILAAFNPAQEWGWIGAGDEEGIGKLAKVAEFLLAQKLVGVFLHCFYAIVDLLHLYRSFLYL